MTCSALAARFTRASGAFPGAVVALAIVQPSADAPLSVAALDGPGLAFLLADDATHRASVRALVQYVPPRGEREAVLRCDWRASKNLARYELRSAKQVLAAGGVALRVQNTTRLRTARKLTPNQQMAKTNERR